MHSSSECAVVPREETTMKKVMIVDDSRTVRQQVVAALGPAGFVVLEAQDGIEALERMKVTPDLSLIICDVNMPRMNGLEMLETVKKTRRTACCQSSCSRRRRNTSLFNARRQRVQRVGL